MTLIDLNKIVSDRDFRTDSEEDETPMPGPVTTPVLINVAAIRCFYPRRDNRPGTRITFTDGGGFAVIEPCDEVTARLRALG